jgi:hypothetical protein
MGRGRIGEIREGSWSRRKNITKRRNEEVRGATKQGIGCNIACHKKAPLPYLVFTIEFRGEKFFDP